MTEATPGLLPHPLTGDRFPSPVRAGTGWPGDLATPLTRVAEDAHMVVQLAAAAGDLAQVDAEVSVCRACPRLVEWRETVAADKRRSFAEQPYWGRPIPGWGSARPKVLVVGLAPAAHGGNRTGRIFTGDRSGDWLFASLHRMGLATRPTSDHAGDGQRLVDTRMLAAVRCAPPGNRPSTGERDSCSPWLDAELRLALPAVRVVVCLGAFAWDALLAAASRVSYPVPRPRPRFAHGARVELGVDDRGIAAGRTARPGPLVILGCYHPSQQNTFTGRLTRAMLDAVLREAAELARA